MIVKSLENENTPLQRLKNKRFLMASIYCIMLFLNPSFLQKKKKLLYNVVFEQEICEGILFMNKLITDVVNY